MALQYQDPGYAATTAVEDYLLKQQQQQHMQLMDQIALQSEKRLAQREVREAQDRQEDRERKKVEDYFSRLTRGDKLDPEMEKLAAKHHIPYSQAPSAANQVQQIEGAAQGAGAIGPGPMGGAPLPSTTGLAPGAYGGSPEQLRGIRISQALSTAKGPEAQLAALAKEGYDPEKAARTVKETQEAIRGPKTQLERAEPTLGLIDAKTGKPAPPAAQQPVLYDPSSGQYTLQGGKPIPQGMTVGRLPAPQSDVAREMQLARLQQLEDKAKENASDKALMESIRKDERLLNGLAMTFRTTNQLPTMGMSKEMNEWVKARALQRSFDPNLHQDGTYFDPKTGVTMPPPVSNPAANRAVYDANKQALNKQQANLAQIRTAVANADRNASIVEDSLKKIPDVKFRRGNTLIREAYRQLGSTDQQQFDTAMTVIKPEYARILTASPTGAGQLSDQARREVGETLPDNATIDQLRLALRVLRQDSRNRMKSGQETVQNLEDALRGGEMGLKDNPDDPAKIR